MSKVLTDLCTQVSISSVSAQSAALPDVTECYVLSTVDCFITVGSNPTATATGAARLFLTAYTYMPLDIRRQETVGPIKIAAITTSASGTLYISPLG